MIGFSSAPYIDGVLPREAGLIAEIHADAFRSTWSAHDFAAMLADASVFALAIRVRNLLGVVHTAGFVLVRFAADEAEILTIAVRSRYRGRGYGRMLMDDVIRRLYREHIARLYLEVERANTAAVSLYSSLGFVVVGERPRYYQGATEGDGLALVMRLQVR